MIYSAAMLLNCDPAEIVEFIKHDGTEITFEGQQGQKQMKGVHIQEIVDFAWTKGYALMQIELFPTIAPDRETQPILIWTKPTCSRRFMAYLRFHDALIWCKAGSSSPEHMVAWDAAEQKVYDSHGFIKPLKDYVIAAAWLAIKIR
jgi:hypothetical protein